MPTTISAPSKSSQGILPCEVCGYDLNGLGSGTYVVCPECGLEQPRRSFLPPWPQGWAAAAWQCGVTFALCNLCLLLLLLFVVIGEPPDFALGMLALITFLSGPVVPIVSGWWLSRRHGADGIHAFIPVGWLLNFLIGLAYLAIAIIVGILTQ